MSKQDDPMLRCRRLFRPQMQWASLNPSTRPVPPNVLERFGGFEDVSNVDAADVLAHIVLSHIVVDDAHSFMMSYALDLPLVLGG